MSPITVTKTFETGETISKEMIMEKIAEVMKGEFKKVIIKETKDGTPMFQCRAKTKLLNPILSFKGPVKIQTEEHEARVTINADGSTTGWIWNTFIILGLFFFEFWIVLFLLYSTQKKSSEQAFHNVCDHLEL